MSEASNGQPWRASSPVATRAASWLLPGEVKTPEQRITVLDDRHDVYRDDDIARLKELSDVVAFSDRQTLRDLLAA